MHRPAARPRLTSVAVEPDLKEERGTWLTGRLEELRTSVDIPKRVWDPLTAPR